MNFFKYLLKWLNATPLIAGEIWVDLNNPGVNIFDFIRQKIPPKGELDDKSIFLKTIRTLETFLFQHGGPFLIIG